MLGNTSHALAQLPELLAQAIQSEQELDGLAPGQWAILRYLAKTKRTSRSSTEIASYTGVAVATVSRALASLERKELIESVTSSDARPSRRYVLSIKGAARTAGDPVVRLRKAIERFPPERPQELGRWLSSIITDLTASPPKI
jgi:DNA-binding MarR family transcriptional regulator